MLSQSLGSYVLGVFIEGGYAYDEVFAASAVLLGVTVVVLFAVDRTGRLPG
jgi:ABC-type maltose transport system permease subunit